jgi:diguanylate cyclase (GGDEF)-like protein
MSNPQKQPSNVLGEAGPSRAGRRTGLEEHPHPAGPTRPVDGTALTRRLLAEIEALREELAASRAEARELASRADIDGLLDVLNRRGFERELKRALAYSKRYGAPAALVYVDLDRFKQINDTHGHAAGDEVLRAAARSLARSVRTSDVVGRLGGDELAVLLWNVTPEGAAAKAAALEQVIATTLVEWDGRQLSVGASAGVAMLAPDDDPPGAIKRADRAMYLRKNARQCLNLRDNVGS